MFSTHHWKRMVVQSVLASALLVPTSMVYAETVTVKAGDTLGNLAYRYDVSVEALKTANRLNTDTINVGTPLYIPPTSSVHTVQTGDTLWKIAEKFRTTISKLVEVNRLTSDELISGEKLLIPLSAESNTHSVYTVSGGDVLWKIASKFDVSIQAIVDANKLTTTELLIGQQLLIPSPAEPVKPPTATKTSDKPWVENESYSVKAGDTPWTISIAHNIPFEEFLKVNNLHNSSYLSIGQAVTIPVHHIPLTEVPGEQYGEYLDWFESAQYLFSINTVAKVTDFETGKSFMVKRTIGAFHSDTEPLTAADTARIKELWGGSFSWSVRPVVVEVEGRKIAASMSSMPHSIEYIKDNDFTGHFDIHFRNSLRHKDNLIDTSHQLSIKRAAGVQ